MASWERLTTNWPRASEPQVRRDRVRELSGLEPDDPTASTRAGLGCAIDGARVDQNQLAIRE